MCTTDDQIGDLITSNRNLTFLSLASMNAPPLSIRASIQSVLFLPAAQCNGVLCCK